MTNFKKTILNLIDSSKYRSRLRKKISLQKSKLHGIAEYNEKAVNCGYPSVCADEIQQGQFPWDSEVTGSHQFKEYQGIMYFNARLNGSNMLVKHHQTSLDPTCLTRLNSMVKHAGLCWTMLDEV